MDVNPARQVESPVLGASPSFWYGPRDGTTESGLRRGAPLSTVGLPSQISAPEM